MVSKLTIMLFSRNLKLCYFQTLVYDCFLLQKDGKTCPSGPVNYLIFAHRVDIRIVSLDVPYLTDVVLPLPPLKNALGVDVDIETGNIYIKFIKL